MEFTVGGEPYDLNREQVLTAMKGITAEPFQKFVVEMLDTLYPPKQVFGTITGRNRSTFTTQEAQRVLTRLGFVCREAGILPDGTPAWIHVTGEGSAPDERLGRFENALTTAQLAIAELQRRVAALEAAH